MFSIGSSVIDRGPPAPVRRAPRQALVRRTAVAIAHRRPRNTQPCRHIRVRRALHARQHGSAPATPDPVHSTICAPNEPTQFAALRSTSTPPLDDQPSPHQHDLRLRGLPIPHTPGTRDNKLMANFLRRALGQKFLTPRPIEHRCVSTCFRVEVTGLLREHARHGHSRDLFGE